MISFRLMTCSSILQKNSSIMSELSLPGSMNTGISDSLPKLVSRYRILLCWSHMLIMRQPPRTKLCPSWTAWLQLWSLKSDQLQGVDKCHQSAWNGHFQYIFSKKYLISLTENFQFWYLLWLKAQVKEKQNNYWLQITFSASSSTTIVMLPVSGLCFAI